MDKYIVDYRIFNDEFIMKWIYLHILDTTTGNLVSVIKV